LQASAPDATFAAMVHPLWRLLVCTLAFSPLFVGAAFAQQVPPPPPDVEAIYQKLRSGKDLTATELKRFEEYNQELSRKYGGGAQNSGSQSKQQNTGGKETAPTAAPGTLKLPCPSGRSAQAVMAPVAPTRTEYIALINSLVDTYGRRLGTHKNELDRVLTASAAQSGSSGIAAALLMTGAASASVYTSAVWTQRHPDDLQAANNLGVALDAIPDSRTAARIFLYVRTQQPDAALAAVNLGWAYYNSGNSALAQKQFEEASRLGPDLPGPSAGLGMLASCRGDQTTALQEFRKSLSKGYSGLVAAGYRNAQQSQSQGETYDVPEQFPPSSDPSFIPELPADPDPPATAASEDTFQHASEFASQSASAAGQKLQDAANRIQALARRAQLNPEGTLDLPRVFDKQLFEYYEVYRITLAGVFQSAGQQDYVNARRPLAADMTAAVNSDYKKAWAAEAEFQKVDRDMVARCGPEYSNRACEAPFRARMDELRRQHDEFMYHACTVEKSFSETDYSRYFKAWKQYSDLLRNSSRDFYAFTQPLINEVWAPALNDMLQAHREITVMSLYQGDAGMASSLAGMAKDLRNLKCVPPPPPKPRRTVKDPAVNKTSSDCPLRPPLKLGLVVVSMEIGCDKVRISGGEILRVNFERNFVKKETTYGIGLGASASLPKIDLGGANGLGEDGKGGWSPPGSAANFSAGGEVMVSVRVNDQGAVQDVGLTSTVSATGKAAGIGGTVGITGSVTMENGANLDPIMSFGASPAVSLPGGLSWKP
jgi:tetratricopeptide (TPR) repeat protein